MAEDVITAKGLTRYFGCKCVLDEVSFAVPRGSVTAFLGRNGSGKTTTLRILLGLLTPTRGSSTILGHDSQDIPPTARGSIGYLAENHPVIPWMTVRQAGEFQAAFFSRWNQKLFDAVVHHFGLDLESRASTLSRGQRAGLALALTLAPEPELLILDDPALGLDPVARRALLESILLITRNPNRTVLLSSHLLDDIERVADYLLILDRAVLRAACPVEEFRKRIAQYQLKFDGTGGVPPLPPIPGLLDSLRVGQMLRITVANPPEDLEGTLRAMGPREMAPVPVDFAEAVTAYMSEQRQRGLFAEALGGAA
jgi:ABC-2 type transport system ATP-binding protein